ncbi:P-loop containing nucleoside triphosphate hydrolase protein [Trametes polyzona]|nr:P-loop containing nucleoside triphosphate hydrolase protein [Trametes polyzona]
MPSTSESTQPPPLPGLQEIGEKTLAVLGRRPCLWQCETALAILKGDKDVICISGTGSGKTLTFWMPLLFRPDGIQVIVTPLNLLGCQNQRQLEQLGIRAIAIRGETATRQNIEDIRAGRYRVVAVSPEVALKPRGIFEQVWRDERFVNRLISVVWDEGHLLKAWASFREELGEASRLRNLIPLNKPYLIPSATLPEATLREVLDIAHVRRDAMVLIKRSNDRPNVYLTVRRIRHPLSSFKDLEFLIPDGWKPGMKIPKFVVFFDNIEDSVRACQVVRQRLPPEYRGRLVWFNADNTTGFRERTTMAFLREDSDIFGLFCTDAFGMGIDIPDIAIVVQWRPTCDMNSLWQRFGRAAREPEREAIAVLFVDSKYFDEEKEAARKRAEKRRAAEELKAVEQVSRKRKRTTGEEDGSCAAPSEAGSRVTILEEASDLERMEAHPDVSFSDVDRLRVFFQTSGASRPAQVRKKARGRSTAGTEDGDEERLDAELDCLINAGSRHFRCYRKPVTAYFENDRVSPDTDVCLTGDGTACGRCNVLPSPVCCSLCSPNHPLFGLLPPADNTPSRQHSSRASQVDGKYSMTSLDVEFRAALHAFRREHTAKLYGDAYLRNIGPETIMGDAILKRIMDCARVHKIRCLDSLYRETKWNRTWELGELVLKLIDEYVPSSSL